jgi:hypothetical protein
MASSASEDASNTGRIVLALENFLGEVPLTTETLSPDPAGRARQTAAAACAKAAAYSGALALPPGPLGLLTIIPDLVGIWRLQAQMVTDIAGAYGKTAFLTRESMLYCLFRHAASHAVRELAVRVGERLLLRAVTAAGVQSVLKKIGLKMTQRLVGKSISRWLGPLAALGVAGYAYYDTAQVAKNAIQFFGSDLVREVESAVS